MSDIRELFKEHCGEKFEKFMDRIYVNDQGEVELFYWQEKKVESFLAKNPQLGLDAKGLLNMLRDGKEIMYSCPEEDCWGDVICIDRNNDFWGCGECGMTWQSKEELLEDI